MAIIPIDEKVFMVSKSTNTTYSGSAALKAMQEWYTMQDIADSLPASSGFNIPLPKSGDSNIGYTVSLTGYPTTVVGQTANALYLVPFIPANDLTITSLSIVVSTPLTPDSLSKILVFGNSTVGITPSGLLIESPDLDCSTAGKKTYNAPYTFKAGTIYWIGTISNSTQRLVSVNPFALMAFGANSSTGQAYTTLSSNYYPYDSPIPNSLGSMVPGTSAVPMVILN